MPYPIETRCPCSCLLASSKLHKQNVSTYRYLYITAPTRTASGSSKRQLWKQAPSLWILPWAAKHSLHLGLLVMLRNGWVNCHCQVRLHLHLEWRVVYSFLHHCSQSITTTVDNPTHLLCSKSCVDRLITTSKWLNIMKVSWMQATNGLCHGSMPWEHWWCSKLTGSPITHIEQSEYRMNIEWPLILTPYKSCEDSRQAHMFRHTINCMQPKLLSN